MQCNLVWMYIVFGTDQKYIAELVFSIASLLNRLPSARVVVYVDRPLDLTGLDIEIVVLRPENLVDWTLNGRYVYRAKILALREALRRSEKVILIDTDTYFTANPCALESSLGVDRFLMHTFEYDLSADPHFAALQHDPRHPYISPQARMFNSGVIGIHEGNMDVVDEILQLNDSMLESGDFGFTHAIEQLAVSLVFQRHGSVSTCECVLDHYYGLRRPFYRAQIRELIDSGKIRTIASGQEPLPRLRGPEADMLSRVISKLRFGTRRSAAFCSAYTAYLCSQRVSTRDTVDFANSWAQLAVFTLRSAPETKSDAGKVFLRFSLDLLDGNTWMTSYTKNLWRQYWGQTVHNPGSG